MLNNKLKQHITDAIAAEQHCQKFTQEMRRFSENRHPAINLPETNPGQSLTEFVTKYVAQVPTSLAAMEKALIKAKTQTLILAIIKITEDFFFKPPLILSQGHHLKGLMEAAYLSHRLIEEVNDRYMAQTTMPLIPVDMLTANLVVHNLIGEPFVNQLDDFCFKLAKVLINPEHSAPQTIMAAKQVLWTHTWQHWSEALEEKEISIDLPQK